MVMKLGKALSLNDQTKLVIWLGFSPINNQHMSTVIGLGKNQPQLPVFSGY
jgi:hypothetical protein